MVHRIYQQNVAISTSRRTIFAIQQRQRWARYLLFCAYKKLPVTFFFLFYSFFYHSYGQTWEWTILPTYKQIRSFHEGLAAIKTQSDKWGFINNEGKLVIDTIYQDVNDFYNGAAITRIFTQKQARISPQKIRYEDRVTDKNSGEWGVINKDGVVVIPHEHYQLKYTLNQYFIKITDIGKHYIFDKNGIKVDSLNEKLVVYENYLFYNAKSKKLSKKFDNNVYNLQILSHNSRQVVNKREPILVKNNTSCTFYTHDNYQKQSIETNTCLLKEIIPKLGKQGLVPVFYSHIEEQQGFDYYYNYSTSIFNQCIYGFWNGKDTIFKPSDIDYLVPSDNLNYTFIATPTGCGFINAKGENITPFHYKHTISRMEKGFAAVLRYKDMVTIIDSTGAEVFTFDNQVFKLSDGCLWLKYRNKWGMVDMKKLMKTIEHPIMYTYKTNPTYDMLTNKKKYLAVLVINDTYEQSTIFPYLKNSYSEVQKIKTILKDFYTFDIVLLHNKTKSELVNYFYSKDFSMKVDSLGNNSHILFYYTGHGIKGTQDSFSLALSDKGSFIKSNELNNLFSNIKTKHLFVIVDACFAGKFCDNIQQKSLYKEIIKGENTDFYPFRKFLASNENESTPSPSPFTRKLIKTLENGLNDGVCSFYDIYENVKKNSIQPYICRLDGDDENDMSNFLFISKVIIDK